MRTEARKLALVMLVGTLLAPVAAVAHGGGPGAGGCPGCGNGPGRHGGGRGFDPAAVTTIRGEVVEIERAGGRGEGVHLVVDMGSERLTVMLGPAFYVDAQPVKLAKGDQVEVKGARVERGGPAIVAQEVRRGGEVLALRDASGVPLWRGQGPRAQAR